MTRDAHETERRVLTSHRTDFPKLTSTLMAQRPMALTALRTKSTSTSVAYSFSSARTWVWSMVNGYQCVLVSPHILRMSLLNFKMSFFSAFLLIFMRICKHVQPFLYKKKSNHVIVFV